MAQLNLPTLKAVAFPNSPAHELIVAKEVAHPHLLAKIDRHIIPIMFAIYFMGFLDKVILNYANITGISTDLGMTNNDFAWLATAFFIAYVVAEIPQGILLQRFPLAKVLGFNVLIWGITISCSSAAQSYGGFMVCRVLLGICEAVITPALTMITSTFYTKREAGPRYGLWYCGLGVGQIIGGLISFGAQYGARGTNFDGWRVMFLCVGVSNIITAIYTCFSCPTTSRVRNSSLLTSEKQFISNCLLTRPGMVPRSSAQAGLERYSWTYKSG